MIIGGLPLLLKNKNKIVENWDDLDAWEVNQFNFINVYPASGTPVASGNEFIVPIYPASGGPLLSIPLGVNVNNFTLTGSMTLTTSVSGRGIIVCGLIDSAATLDSHVYVQLADNTTSASIATNQTVGKDEGVFVETSSANSGSGGTFNIDFEFTRDGTSFTTVVTGDFSRTVSFTSDVPLDTLFCQIARLSGVAVVPLMSIGPLTLEYS